MASTGNSTDFADVIQEGTYQAGLTGNNDRGISNGSYSPASDVIQYITISSTGDAVDFGDLTASKGGCAAVSSGTRGCVSGGILASGGSYTNIIDYIDPTILGNATDFGDMTDTNGFHVGTSGD